MNCIFFNTEQQGTQYLYVEKFNHLELSITVKKKKNRPMKDVAVSKCG